MISGLRDGAARLGALKGWRRNAVAFAFGICATFTLAPFFIFPLIVPAFAGLYILVNAAPSRRRSFWDGWWWGWGFYITGLYWFCVALLTDPEHFAWLIPFALFGITAVIAIYPAIACWLVARLKLSGLTNIFAFSFIWFLAEYARGHLLSGFPWNLEGYSFGFADAPLQMASLAGAYGLTWFAVLLGVSFAALADRDIPVRRSALFVMIVWEIFTVGTVWGALRINGAQDEFVPNVMLRLVQADIEQPHKWDPRLEKQEMFEHVKLTQSPGLEKITHVIWPETAVPYIVKEDTPITRILGQTVPDHAMLITGAMRAAGNETNWDVWNSMAAIDHSGAITGAYDKAKLVPFGEFQPLRDFVPKSWMTPVGDKDFSRGPGPQTLTWGNLPPLSPLICYEAIFPDLAASENPRPDWMLNITNDAWFGTSIGPYQHFNMVRMRTVEQGIPLVRVANSGITAVVDGFGRIIKELPLGSKGFIDSALPKPLNQQTIYISYARLIFTLLIFVQFIFIIRQKIVQKN